MKIASMTSLLIALLCIPSSAAASGFSGGEGYALLPGLTLGATLYQSELNSPGFFIGGEVSFVDYDLDRPKPGGYTPSAFGGYIDAVYDFGADATRISLGPEVAWYFVGLDGGYLLQLQDGRAGHGLTARLFATVLVPGIFVRVGRTWGELDNTSFELGFTFKIPVLLDR